MSVGLAETSVDYTDPLLRDRCYGNTPLQVVAALRSAVASFPRWRFVTYDPISSEIHLQRHTSIVRYTNDIVLHIGSGDAMTTITIRSIADSGWWRLRQNRRNLGKILRELDRRLRGVVEGYTSSVG